MVKPNFQHDLNHLTNITIFHYSDKSLKTNSIKFQPLIKHSLNLSRMDYSSSIYLFTSQTFCPNLDKDFS